jgi:parvulin-like peptidyl-prolyl isomerase
MKRNILSVAVAMSMALLFSGQGVASPAAVDLPLAGGKPVLARINGEPLLLEEFARAFVGIHGEASDNAARSQSKPSVLLDRMINARLVLQEARNIGLHELPEVRKAEISFEEDTMRRMLFGYHVRDIRTADKKEVEKRYREMVKEVKIKSVLFDKEEDAKRVEAAVKAGAGFDAAAKKELDAGAAKGSVEGQYLKYSSLSPVFEKAVSSMKKGEVSPLIPIGRMFSLVKLEDVRYPEDKAARERAEKEALQAKRTDALKAYTDGLRKKYGKIDRKLLDGIDFDSPEPGIEKLRADMRVLATVKGGKPVTVGELTAALEKQFFHGTERAAAGKKVDARKEQTLDEILTKQVALLEAKRRKFDQSEYFKAMVKENRENVLFGAFVKKVIMPDVAVSDQELKAYFERHVGEYTSPEIVRIDGLLFSEKGKAEDAIGKLRGGADFQWIRANAEGQVDPAKEKDLLEFKGQVLVSNSLPEGVRKAISGASTGDYRLYADPGKAYYVLDLLERIPPSPVSLDSVKGEIEKKVRAEKLQGTLRDWESKLRKASNVKIYATGKKLDRIVKPGTR